MVLSLQSRLTEIGVIDTMGFIPITLHSAITDSIGIRIPNPA